MDKKEGGGHPIHPMFEKAPDDLPKDYDAAMRILEQDTPLESFRELSETIAKKYALPWQGPHSAATGPSGQPLGAHTSNWSSPPDANRSQGRRTVGCSAKVPLGTCCTPHSGCDPEVEGSLL